MPITFAPPLNAKSAVIKMSIAMILFGSVGFFSERSGLPALELVFIRCICAMLFLGLFWIFSGKLRHEKWHVPEVLRILLCSVFLILNWVYFLRQLKCLA